MLGTLLDKLSALVSKSFVIASFIPLLAFAALNGLLLFEVSAGFRRFVAQYGKDANLLLACAVSLSILAFLFSMLNTWLRELMEGKGWPGYLASRSARTQWVHYTRLTSRHDELQRQRRILKLSSPGKDSKIDEWRARMRDARNAPHDPAAQCRYNAGSDAAVVIEALRDSRASGERITAEDLQLAVDCLCEDLKENPLPKGIADFKELLADEKFLLQLAPDQKGDFEDKKRAARVVANVPASKYKDTEAARRVAWIRFVQQRRGKVPKAQLDSAIQQFGLELAHRPIPPDLEAGRKLDNDQADLNQIVRYAARKVLDDVTKLFNERQFSFPGGALAPTSMGNIERSINSYTFSRYQFDMETFWTRLQKVIQNEAFYAVLQDAKMQVDFLVSIFWLLLISAIAWLAGLACLAHERWLYTYCGIALGAPVALWAVYGLALQNYRAFADLMRSSVDLYRLDLLTALQLMRPEGSRQETRVWEALRTRVEFGGDTNLTYRRLS